MYEDVEVKVQSDSGDIRPPTFPPRFRVPGRECGAVTPRVVDAAAIRVQWAYFMLRRVREDAEANGRVGPMSAGASEDLTRARMLLEDALRAVRRSEAVLGKQFNDHLRKVIGRPA